MIQRIQTIYLLVTIICSILILIIPFHVTSGVTLYFRSDKIIAALNVAVAIILIFTVFQYKSRKLQVRLSVISLLLILIITGLIVIKIYNANGTFIQVGFILSLLSILSIALAIKYIRKDENLIRSMDRLR